MFLFSLSLFVTFLGDFVHFLSFPLLVWKWRFPSEVCSAALETKQTGGGVTSCRGLAPPPTGCAAVLHPPHPHPQQAVQLCSALCLALCCGFQFSLYKFVSLKTHLLILLQNQCPCRFTTYSPVFSSFLDPSLPKDVLNFG